jgi:predicted PurR-regulated permease PerM
MWYNKKFFKASISTLLVLLIVFLGFQLFPLFLLVFQFITTLFFPVIGAGIFYYIFRPVVHFFDKKKISRYLSISFIYLFMIIGLVIIISTVWPYVEQQVSEFNAFPKEKLKEVENKTVDIMNLFNINSLSHEELRDLLLYYLQKITVWVTGGFITNITSITKVASYFIITPFILFYFLKDDHNVSKKIIKLIPADYEDEIKKIIYDVDQVLSGYISGQVLVALIVGFLIFIGYFIIGLGYAFLLAIVAFIFNLIPFGGPLISTIPALLIGLAQSPLMAVKVIIVVLVVHLLDLNLISPRVVGFRLNIHPITIILLLVASISLFGFLSLFFIVPVYAVLKTLILDLWKMKIVDKDIVNISK